MTCMAKEGIEAFAIDLLGFGHSNKPPLTYTQYLWENNVRSFIGSVVQRNVILAGNSIGGFIATAAAAGLRCLQSFAISILNFGDFV